MKKLTTRLQTVSSNRQSSSGEPLPLLITARQATVTNVVYGLNKSSMMKDFEHRHAGNPKQCIIVWGDKASENLDDPTDVQYVDQYDPTFTTSSVAANIARLQDSRSSDDQKVLALHHLAVLAMKERPFTTKQHDVIKAALAAGGQVDPAVAGFLGSGRFQELCVNDKFSYHFKFNAHTGFFGVSATTKSWTDIAVQVNTDFKQSYNIYGPEGATATAITIRTFKAFVRRGGLEAFIAHSKTKGGNDKVTAGVTAMLAKIKDPDLKSLFLREIIEHGNLPKETVKALLDDVGSALGYKDRSAYMKDAIEKIKGELIQHAAGTGQARLLVAILNSTIGKAALKQVGEWSKKWDGKRSLIQQIDYPLGNKLLVAFENAQKSAYFAPMFCILGAIKDKKVRGNFTALINRRIEKGKPVRQKTMEASATDEANIEAQRTVAVIADRVNKGGEHFKPLTEEELSEKPKTRKNLLSLFPSEDKSRIESGGADGSSAESSEQSGSFFNFSLLAYFATIGLAVIVDLFILLGKKVFTSSRKSDEAGSQDDLRERLLRAESLLPDSLAEQQYHGPLPRERSGSDNNMGSERERRLGKGSSKT